MKRLLANAACGTFLLAIVPASFAATPCVDSDQKLAAAFQQAYFEALDSGGTSAMEIRLERSTTPYELGTVLSSAAYPVGTLRIKGGYGAGCASRSVSADNTTIHANEDVEVYFSKELLLEGLTYDARDVQKTFFSLVGQIPASAVLRTIRARGTLLVGAMEGALNAEVVNSIFQDSTNPSANSCALSLSVALDGTMDGVVRSSTFALNQGSGLCVRYVSTLDVRESIFWENAYHGIRDVVDSPTTAVTTSFNIMQPSNRIQPGGLAVGNLVADPLFLDDELHISPNSPAANSGSPDTTADSVPSRDVFGETRMQGRIDRGAHETSAIDSGVIVVTAAGDPFPTPATATSLREAIEEANQSPGHDIILFDVDAPEICPVDILLTSPLPQITESLTIDGLSQATASVNSSVDGFNGNTCVSLRTNNPQLNVHALEVPAGTNAQLIVRGLEFMGFQTTIALRDGSGHQLVANRFRQSPDTQRHVHVTSLASKAQIGGYDVASANEFGATQGGPAVGLHSENNMFRGNRVSGEGGIVVESIGNEVALNIFRDLDDVAISLRGNNATVFNNLIENTGGAIRIDQFFQIDGTGNGNQIYGNIISNNDAGIVVMPKTHGNRIVSNRISGNDGLAIDLDGNASVNPNLAVVPPGRANDGQQYPVLTSAIAVDGYPKQADVQGSLVAEDGTYLINVYANPTCDPLGHGEAAEPVGSKSVAVVNGTAFFTIPVASEEPLANRHLAATATSSVHGTSELSACAEVLSGLPAEMFGDGFE